MACTTEKMALFAPMHSASVAMAMTAKPGVLSSERRAYFRSVNMEGDLFAAQRDDGVDLGGAMGGNPAGDAADQGEEDRDPGVDQRVGGADVVKLGGEQAREAEGHPQPEPDADQGESQA